MNESNLVYERMGIDIWEVIDAAATKPFGYMPFYPGPGLGGHCMPIDPFYLTWKAREYDLATKFIELAGEIDVSMPGHVGGAPGRGSRRSGWYSAQPGKRPAARPGDKKNVAALPTHNVVLG